MKRNILEYQYPENPGFSVLHILLISIGVMDRVSIVLLSGTFRLLVDFFRSKLPFVIYKIDYLYSHILINF